MTSAAGLEASRRPCYFRPMMARALALPCLVAAILAGSAAQACSFHGDGMAHEDGMAGLLGMAHWLRQPVDRPQTDPAAGAFPTPAERMARLRAELVARTPGLVLAPGLALAPGRARAGGLSPDPRAGAPATIPTDGVPSR